jgi:hypothetical protein
LVAISVIILPSRFINTTVNGNVVMALAKESFLTIGNSAKKVNIIIKSG